MRAVCHLDEIILLQSREGFREWYLKWHGGSLTIFSQDNIDSLLEEVEPSYYPCYALLLDGKYEVIYLDPELLFFITEGVFTPVDDLSVVSM